MRKGDSPFFSFPLLRHIRVYLVAVVVVSGLGAVPPEVLPELPASVPLGLSCLASDPCEPLAGGAVVSVVADEAPPADGEDAGVSGVGEAVCCFSGCVVSSFLAGTSGEDVVERLQQA